jgi:hypothetical protein
MPQWDERREYLAWFALGKLGEENGPRSYIEIVGGWLLILS